MAARAGGAIRAGKIVLVGAGAVFLAWNVVKTSSINALIRENPAAAAAFSMNDPRVGIAIGMAEFQVGNGRVGPVGQRRLRDALARAPLAEEPFVVEGIQLLAAGDAAKGQRFLEEARRRNPRSRAARLILLDRYLRANQLEQAGVEITVLNRLIPRAGEALVPELARMAAEPRTGTALIEVLGREPALQQSVLQRLASTGADPDLILRLARSSRPAAGGPQGQAWQGVLLERLVRNGDYSRAYQLWRNFAAVPETALGQGVYDGRFAGLPGPPPFNWQLTSGANGVAERSNEASLQIDYYGRAEVELASQLLMLRPGRQRLQFKVQGDAKGEGSRLEWTLTCARGGGELVRLPLTDVTYTPRTMSADFTVPAGCAAQWLRLKGIAGEVPTGQTAAISDLAVTGGGRS